MTRSDLIDWLNHLVSHQRQPVILIGHSWGGRLLLSILEELPFQVHGLILIAPDGLGTPGLDLWYRLGSRLQKWLSRQISFSKSLVGLSRFLHRIGIINRHGIRFMEHHLQTPERRKRLQLFARSSADFRIRWKDLRTFQEKHRIPIHLFFGANDPLIDFKKGKKKAKQLPQATIHLIEGAGHPLKDQRMANAVKEILPDIYPSAKTEG
jgi:pimeloyl-ACP methyl ester carboxylesterase